MTNGHLEPWDFGHEGWVNESLAVHVTAPYKDALVVEALAWTPGTNGRITAAAFNLVTPEGPEAAAAADAPAAARGGRGPARLGPDAGGADGVSRERQEQDRGERSAGRPAGLRAGEPPAGGRTAHRRTGALPLRPGRRQRPGVRRRAGRLRSARRPRRRRGQAPPDGRLTAAQVAQQVDRFLLDNKAALRINDAGRPHGQIVAFNSRAYDTSQAVPTVVMRNEDYGRIARMLADGTPVEIEAEIVNKTLPGGQDLLQHHRGDCRQRQEGRSRDARRPSRFVALRDRRHRQRHRLRDHDGSGAHPEGDRRAAAPHDPRRAVERRRRRPARLARLRQGALRLAPRPRSRSSRSSPAI